MRSQSWIPFGAYEATRRSPAPVALRPPTTALPAASISRAFQRERTADCGSTIDQATTPLVSTRSRKALHADSVGFVARPAT
jgi:hypothetical protein